MQKNKALSKTQVYIDSIRTKLEKAGAIGFTENSKEEILSKSKVALRIEICSI
ncbi:hypothetical protein [Penaeicola halotolerans]|uniref:hypothetical protein n=1 Tax=Penaeicola halotolerans TaxID=2793196 RepID=UPI001CF87CA4|nr:hypothetical protein [Penaeicola halotolerans]